VDCILDDTRPLPDVEDAVNTHEVCIAIDMSVANGGEVVKLPLIKD